MSAEKIKLWFFRDLSDEQRRKLFAIFGMPSDQLYTHGTQEKALRHVFSALTNTSGDDEAPVAWRYRHKEWSEDFWNYFTKEPRYKEDDEIWQALYARPHMAASSENKRIADALEACDWSGCSIGNKEILKAAVRALARPQSAAVRDEAKDKARLDFLDECNARLNAKYGTNYRWELILSPNVNRLMINHMAVDLNDMAATGLLSCRDAIDLQMKRTAADRAALHSTQEG